jgi:DNA-binding MarR family transcriptional regulator
VGEVSASRELLPALAVLPGHVLWRAQARVVATLAERLPPGVDLHSYAVLVALADGVPRSQQELSDRVAVSRTTMVKVASDLVAQGLVERVRNPHDRRSYALTRTPAGAAAVRRWAAHVEELEAALTADVSAARRADLVDLLLRVAAPDLDADVPEELRGSIAFLVTRVQQRMHREVAAALGPLGVEPRHLGSLAALRALGPVPQSELARALGVTPASTVAIVDALEELRLVERRRSTTDRRTQVLHLTDRAPEVAAGVRDVAGPVVAGVLAPLDAEERERLLTLLRGLVTAP